ncbi:MAG: hypothetical protein IIW39_00025 [Clostridia bacterium]|nr:hypothetical protein [Clostridia bacterium]
MKRINNEAILDTVYDLADANGLRIDRFLELIEEEFGEQPIDTEGLPEEVITELKNARINLKEQKKQLRLQKDNEAMAQDVRAFRESFPDVSADSIPDSVWEEVANGVSLPHAYALYEAVSSRLNERAESVNARNGNISEMSVQNGVTEPEFTKEQVEKMSGKDVRSNYKNILKAMKSWHF